MTRWRAEIGRLYFMIAYDMRVIPMKEELCCVDSLAYNSGNYFKTRDEAEAVAEKFRAVLKEHHEAKNLRENEFLGRNVSDCDFPLRAIHQLENAGITTVSQLVTFTRKDLREKGVGPKTSVQIEEVLNGMGLKLNY